MHLIDGAKVRGSWNNNTYQIMSKLGEGNFGQVFLVENNGKKHALKLSKHVVSITKEYRMLLQLNKDKGLKNLKALPDVVDTDDCTMVDDLYRFIVLEYFDGNVLSSLLERKILLEEKELVEIGISLGRVISCLHQRQLALGDLKPANLFYEKDKPLKIVDLGGVTPFGAEVEEYTPMFDRATWQMGTRIAEPSYDIFACCILLTLLATGNRLLDLDGGKENLLELVAKLTWTKGTKQTIINGLLGRYEDVGTFIGRLEKNKLLKISRNHGFH
ncbi:MAG: protein kinase [Bacillota bacterium]|nr:protein kinase [Bacillota bacterium]